jgi:hypothetical protein
LEVGLWWVSFKIFSSAVRLALVILLPVFLVAACIVQYDLDAPGESLHDCKNKTEPGSCLDYSGAASLSSR